MNLATREAYGNTLAELKDNENVVVLEADLGHATKSLKFKEVCPQRFFNMGIAEADMIGTAAGLAACGKVPFASTFSVFATGRAFDQVRNSVCYPNLNVKIVGTHAGITVGEDGGTHQAIEDIALMRSLPNMSIVVPSDDVEARAAVLAQLRIRDRCTCAWRVSHPQPIITTAMYSHLVKVKLYVRAVILPSLLAD